MDLPNAKAKLHLSACCIEDDPSGLDETAAEPHIVALAHDNRGRACEDGNAGCRTVNSVLVDDVSSGLEEHTGGPSAHPTRRLLDTYLNSAGDGACQHSTDLRDDLPLYHKGPNLGQAESTGYTRGSKRVADRTSSLQQGRRPKRQCVGAAASQDANQGDDGEDKKNRCIATPPGEPTFACPFYKRNPISHMDCLNLKLSRICDVKLHLTRRHSQPPFCPTCYAPFASPESRDAHIRSRRCEAPSTTRAGGPVGISPEAILRLKVRTGRNVPPADRWYIIWDIIFKEEPRPSTPYLGSILEEAIGVIRASWRQEEPRVVAAFLHGQPTQVRDSCEFGPLLMYFLNHVQSRYGRSSHGVDSAGPIATAPPPAAPLPLLLPLPLPLPRPSQEDNGSAWQPIDSSFASQDELLQSPSINAVPAMEDLDWDFAQELANQGLDHEWSQEL